jgi:hypothetical protein
MVFWKPTYMHNGASKCVAVMYTSYVMSGPIGCVAQSDPAGCNIQRWLIWV